MTDPTITRRLRRNLIRNWARRLRIASARDGALRDLAAAWCAEASTLNVDVDHAHINMQHAEAVLAILDSKEPTI